MADRSVAPVSEDGSSIEVTHQREANTDDIDGDQEKPTVVREQILVETPTSIREFQQHSRFVVGFPTSRPASRVSSSIAITGSEQKETDTTQTKIHGDSQYEPPPFSDVSAESNKIVQTTIQQSSMTHTQETQTSVFSSTANNAPGHQPAPPTDTVNAQPDQSPQLVVFEVRSPPRNNPFTCEENEGSGVVQRKAVLDTTQTKNAEHSQYEQQQFSNVVSNESNKTVETTATMNKATLTHTQQTQPSANEQPAVPDNRPITSDANEAPTSTTAVSTMSVDTALQAATQLEAIDMTAFESPPDMAVSTETTATLAGATSQSSLEDRTNTPFDHTQYDQLSEVSDSKHRATEKSINDNGTTKLAEQAVIQDRSSSSSQQTSSANAEGSLEAQLTAAVNAAIQEATADGRRVRRVRMNINFNLDIDPQSPLEIELNQLQLSCPPPHSVVVNGKQLMAPAPDAN